jgi:hypothetical protein
MPNKQFAPILGFTGTQSDLTSKQRSLLVEVLETYWVAGSKILHHGDCVGADATAHTIWKAYGGNVEIHPPKNQKKRAHCVPGTGDVVHPEHEYLIRNDHIAKACDILIATPGQMTEMRQGSGTWATIRYARNCGKAILIILPDGTTRAEETS